MFKRRAPRTYLAAVGRALWPRGGWWRAIVYMVHRLRRLPDPAHKISRGIAAGVFTSFTPLFGAHFLVAAGLAWLLRGNVVASLLATFVGNPLTFPVIAGVSVELGSRMLGLDHTMPLGQTFAGFSMVSVELWSNVKALFTPDIAEWGRVSHFFRTVFLPYLVGGIVPGVFAGCLAYIISRPLIATYQKARIARLKKRFAKQREATKAGAARSLKGPGEA